MVIHATAHSPEIRNWVVARTRPSWAPEMFPGEKLVEYLTAFTDGNGPIVSGLLIDGLVRWGLNPEKAIKFSEVEAIRMALLLDASAWMAGGTA